MWRFRHQKTTQIDISGRFPGHFYVYLATTPIWKTATGEELSPLEGHAGLVLSVAFSPDSERLVSSSGDSTVKLWDISTGKQVLSLKASPGLVHRVVYSPDGKTIASSTESEGVIKLWRADIDEEKSPRIQIGATQIRKNHPLTGHLLLCR